MNKRTKSNSIRIIGGHCRGRRLPVLDRPGLRPTIDRVRETLFNWLMHDVAGADCLDLFAGSGALGLECYSRGAAFVQMVESDPEVASCLSNNASLLSGGDDSVNVHNGGALEYLESSVVRQYNVLFLDPPFGSELLNRAVSSLLSGQWLAEDAMIYIELPANNDDFEVPENWQVFREGRAGQSRYCLYSS